MSEIQDLKETREQLDNKKTNLVQYRQSVPGPSREIVVADCNYEVGSSVLVRYIF